MKDVVEAILKFLSELTPKRILGLLIFIGIATFAINVYEYYTGAFECKRIERTVSLIGKLHDLDQSGILSNQCLSPIYLSAVERTAKVLNNPPISASQKSAVSNKIPESTTLSTENKQCDAGGQSNGMKARLNIAWWKKGLASSWLWLLFAICTVPGILRGKDDKAALFGMLVFAGLIWIIGGFIPAIWWPWCHAGIFVFIQVLVIIVPIVIASNNKKKA